MISACKDSCSSWLQGKSERRRTGQEAAVGVQPSGDDGMVSVLAKRGADVRLILDLGQDLVMGCVV